MKETWKPGTVIYPLPAVLVSCGDEPASYNLLTVSWTGTICTEPPMCYVSIRPERHSYEIIRRTGAFVINLTTESMARATDWCGVRSGRDYDKFRETGLTPLPSERVAAPLVAEAPVSIECRVKQILPLGSHDMFIAEVAGVVVDDAYIDPATGKFHLEKAAPIVYSHGEYFGLGEALGHFGWSVRRKGTGQSAKEPGKRTAGAAAGAGASDSVPGKRAGAKTAGPKPGAKRTGAKRAGTNSTGKGSGSGASAKRTTRPKPQKIRE